MGNLTTRKNENEVVTQDSQPSKHGCERTVTPRASVYETPDSVILELEMAGVSKDNVEVKVENDELTVTGRRFIPSDEGLEMLHQERLPLSYRRAFILSDRIDTGKINATCNNGVLRLVLPKSAQAQPRKIAIE